MPGVFAVVAAALALSASPASAPDVALHRQGIEGELATFLRAKAYVEARGNPLALNRHDADAGRRAARRLRREGRLPDCGRSADEYAFSGGLYGQLPAIAIVVSHETIGTDVCEDPVAVFDANKSTRMAVAYAARLQRRREYREHPSWKTLWLGFRDPDLMSDRGHSLASRGLRNMKKGLRRTGGRLRHKPPSLTRIALAMERPSR